MVSYLIHSTSKAWLSILLSVKDYILVRTGSGKYPVAKISICNPEWKVLSAFYSVMIEEWVEMLLNEDVLWQTVN